MTTALKTTGDLRTFLLDTMVAVKSGSMKREDASTITKLAQQTTENLYAELKAKKLAMEASEPTAQLGTLNLGK
jgi:hypothetical protein